MTLQAFRHEEAVKVGDDTLRLVLNFRALDAIESETQRPFDSILLQLTAHGVVPPTSLVSRVVWGLLREHHPDVDIDQATGLVNGPMAAPVGVAMGKLFETGFPRAAPVEAKDKPGTPPEAAWSIEAFFVAWCGEALSPDLFWVQSPRTYVAVMKGRAHAAKQKHENVAATGWYGEVFARQKKLKPLAEYLSSGDAGPVQPEVVLDAMMTLKAHGVPMEVRKVD